MALRHCILYEFLRENPIEQSFIALRKAVGPGVIEKKEFQVWFNQFEQGIFDIDDYNGPITDMRDVLRSDKYALRACVLYESIKYKQFQRGFSSVELWPNSNVPDYNMQCNQPFFFHNNFCKVIGDNVIEYMEFEFWFYRFLKGEFDLNYERKDEKNIKEFTDLPIDVMKEIIGYLDIFDRAKLVQTSRSLQTFVEDQELFYHTLKLTVSNNSSNVSIDKSVNIKYLLDYPGCEKHFKNNVTTVQGVPHWKQAVLDLKSVLKTPNLELNTLEIESKVEYRSVFDDLEDALEFTHSSNVRKLILKEYSLDKLLNIIPSLKPRYLTTINIVSRNPNVDSMQEVFEMEQWKQAKYFKMDGACFIWPLHHLYHFKKFTVALKELSLDDVRQMKEILFKSSKFERCVLRIPKHTYKSICKQAFGDALREDPFIYHYPIPNSTEYFEIKVGGWSLNIQRHKS